MKKDKSVRPGRPDIITQHRLLHATLFDNQVELMTTGTIERAVSTDPEKLATKFKTYVTSYHVGVRPSRQLDVYFLTVNHRNHETEKQLGFLANIYVADDMDGELTPREGFTMDDAVTVKAQAEALMARQKTDLPNLLPIMLNAISASGH